jgi:hypothetical protein
MARWRYTGMWFHTGLRIAWSRFGVAREGKNHYHMPGTRALGGYTGGEQDLLIANQGP